MVPRPCRLRCGLLPAVAGGVHRHFSASESVVKLLLDQGGFHGFTAPSQTFVQAVKTPQIAQMLAGATQRLIQTQVGPVHRFRFFQVPLFQQERA